MALSAEQLKARDGKLTASRVGVLMNGSPEDILALWQVMTGQREEDDLSHIWAVRLGTVTEELNLAWYEYKTGRAVTRRGEVVVCPHADWAACTLDGFDAELHAVIEAKHVGGFEPHEKVIARYQPQFHWQMICTDTRLAIPSIIEGAREPVIEDIPFDEGYAGELWQRAEAFMQAVNDLVPPIALPPVAAPIAPEQWRTVSFEGHNEWGSFAADWLQHKDAAKTFDKAAKGLKGLVEADIGLAHGHGCQVKRAKNGNLSISEQKEISL